MSIHPDSGRPSMWRRSAIAAVLLAGTALGGFTAGHAVFAADVQPVNPPGTTVAPRTIPDFTQLVSQVKPAVVSITTKLKTDADDEEGPTQGMPQFRPRSTICSRRCPGCRHGTHAIEARGSGFIINANGTIVTNNHVVKDAQASSSRWTTARSLPPTSSDEIHAPTLPC